MLARLGRRLKAAIDRRMSSTGASLATPAVVAFIGRVRAAAQDAAPSDPPPVRMSMRDVLRGIAEKRRASRVLAGAPRSSANASGDGPEKAATEILRMAVEADPFEGIDPDFFERPAYDVAELTSFDGSIFVDATYRCLLKRPADELGLEAFARRLFTGNMDRIDVIRALSLSPEGRARGVEVRGLAWLSFWRRARHAPIVGPTITWIHAFLRLPRLARQYQALEARGNAQWQRLQDDTRHLAVGLGAAASRIDAQARKVTSLDAGLARSTEWLDDHARAVEALDAQHARLVAEVEGLGTTIASTREGLQTQWRQGAQAAQAALRAAARDFAEEFARSATRLDAVEATAAASAGRLDAVDHRAGALADAATILGQRVDALGDAAVEMVRSLARDATLASDRLNRAEAHASRQDAEIANTIRRVAPLVEFDAVERFTDDESTSLEPFYTGLEARFRGARDDIMRRFEPYLAFVRDAGAGTPERPVIDLGCGRGEWLELLKTNNLHGYGIDSSAEMVAHCRGLGLSAECADVLTYLRTTASDSFGMVSAMHLVEHLSFKTLVLLIREIRRVLKPGGLLLFETPNPENLFVAAYAFRMDPTHRVPLPPPLLEYLVESQGFDHPDVLRMNAGAYGNPFGDLPPPDEAVDDIAGRLRAVVEQHLFGPPDFAVIARRPATPESVST